MAFVVPAAGGGGGDVEEIRLTCRAHLASYKCPKEIHLVEELPVTAYGEVDKKLLRQRQASVTA
jgi:fatty-acyl-CoA synthase